MEYCRLSLHRWVQNYCRILYYFVKVADYFLADRFGLCSPDEHALIRVPTFLDGLFKYLLKSKINLLNYPLLHFVVKWNILSPTEAMNDLVRKT